MTVLAMQSEIFSHGFGALHRFLATIEAWRERRHGRTMLAHMDQHELKDLGLSPSDVYAEIEKPFWRA